MTVQDLLPTRLRQQQLAHQRMSSPGDLVAWLGAVQAQDYTAAKWAIGQRLRTAVDDEVEEAFAEGSVLRTHVLRPTWHFVTPADIRWMVALSAPRLRRIMGYYLREHGVDRIVSRSLAVFERSLRDGRQLTRTELADALVQARVSEREPLLTNHVMGHLLGWAEIEGLVCSGARRGTQFTYALLDERVPPMSPVSREEALGRLALRYFTSHGPATMKDFVWWSGLTVADARLGVELSGTSLSGGEYGGRHYWRAARVERRRADARTAHLLPNYDEYIVAYADRSLLMDASSGSRFRAKSSVLFAHTIVAAGRVIGTWTRSYKPRTVDVTLHLLRPVSGTERDAVDRALAGFGRFVAPLRLRVVTAPRGQSR